MFRLVQADAREWQNDTGEAQTIRKRGEEGLMCTQPLRDSDGHQYRSQRHYCAAYTS
jgi:hypothetical protein